MAIYYYCSRIMPETKCWDDLKKLLNMDLEGKRKKSHTFQQVWITPLPLKKSKKKPKADEMVLEKI